MIDRSARMAIAILAVLLIAGCGSRTNLPQSQSDAQVANIQLVTDIPIPPNATMDNDRSLILSDRDHWTGRVVMRFWQSTAELTAFYQAQMPGFGWEPVMSVTSESSVLSYIRSDRAATVVIEKSSLGLVSAVSVTVAPRQSGSAQPAMGMGGTGMGSAGMGSPLRQPVQSDPLPPPSHH